MATVKEIAKIIEKFAPLEIAVKSEYNGLMCGDKDAVVTKILLCLDVTPEVVGEAKETGAELIISHHPMIYSPVNRVTADDITGRCILEAAKAGINIYSAHTNLDNSDEGINDFLIRLAGAEKSIRLYHGEDIIGRIADILPATLTEVAQRVASGISDKVSVIGAEKSVDKVAVICGGGGGNTGYIDIAADKGAQVLITGDIKHHVALYAVQTGMRMIDASHYSTEYGYLPVLQEKLQKLIGSGIGIEVSKQTNPRRLI